MNTNYRRAIVRTWFVTVHNINHVIVWPADQFVPLTNTLSHAHAHTYAHILSLAGTHHSRNCHHTQWWSQKQCRVVIQHNDNLRWMEADTYSRRSLRWQSTDEWISQIAKRQSPGHTIPFTQPLGCTFSFSRCKKEEKKLTNKAKQIIIRRTYNIQTMRIIAMWICNLICFSFLHKHRQRTAYLCDGIMERLNKQQMADVVRGKSMQEKCDISRNHLHRHTTYRQKIACIIIIISWRAIKSIISAKCARAKTARACAFTEILLRHLSSSFQHSGFMEIDRWNATDTSCAYETESKWQCGTHTLIVNV